jgi:hypothetical protein
LAEFPTSGITYDVTAVPASYWERLNSLLNRALFYSVASPEFGADPSGVADSSSAIAACWAAAPAYSTIWYPPGSAGQATYKITSALVHPAKPLFHYTPKGGAVIKQMGANGLNVFESNGADGWSVDGLVFDANYPTRTSGRTLQLQNSTDWRMTNYRVQNSADMGTVLTAGCARFWLDHFTYDSTENSGIWFGENTGSVENFWITDGWLTNTNVANAVGHAGVQSLGAAGAAPTLNVRKGHFRDVVIDAYTRVGWGMDLITDSTFTDCEARGEHTGEAMALTGSRNTVRGGRYGESTGAAGLLLWCWVGNGQDGRDTEISGVYLPGPVAGGNQGLAIVPAENNVTFRDIDIHGIRAKGWNYGVQNYNTPGPKTGITMSASVVVHDSNLRDNATGHTLFASAGATLRDNVP